MLDRKKRKLGESINQSSDEKAFLMPDVLANLSTGLDIFQIELQKLADAPKEWNFYKPLPQDKMDELIMSIEEIGLMHPLVVWEKDDGQYMILSGHNRKKAFEILLEKTNHAKYEKIYCYVKKSQDLNEEKAKEIIIDTNWVQRQLSPIEKAKSIYKKYTSISRKKTSYELKSEDGYTRDIIAKEYHISGRQVSNYYRLNYLIEEFQNMVAQNEVSIRMGVKLAMFEPKTQTYLYEKHRDHLNLKTLQKIDPHMRQEYIEQLLEDEIANSPQGLKVDLSCALIPEKKDDFLKEFEELVDKYHAKDLKVRIK